MSDCTCSEVWVGTKRANVKNIDEDCPEHGVGTAYYNGRVAYWGARLRILRDKKRAQDA